MNRTNVIAIAVLIGIIFLGTGIYLVYQNRKAQEEVSLEPVSLPSPITKFPITSPTPSAQGSQASRQPDSGISDIMIKKIGITILEPNDNSLATSPMIIRGYANVFEGRVELKLKDANGNTLGLNTAMGCMGEEACPFEVPLIFTKPESKSGTLEAFSNSPRDGSVENLTTVPVSF